MFHAVGFVHITELSIILNNSLIIDCVLTLLSKGLVLGWYSMCFFMFKQFTESTECGV